MKVLKNPVVAIILCLAIMIASTCINAKVGLEKKYDRICGNLTQSIIDFADANDLTELESKARSAKLDGDYAGLIEIYNASSAAHSSAVDSAVDRYAAFFRSLQRFPARQLVGLLGIGF